MMYPLIKPGKRAMMAGRTGSGKSTWACWMLDRSPGNWVILNPKHTQAYKDLEDATIIETLDPAKISRAIERYRFVIINPGTRDSAPDALDNFVMTMHEDWRNIGLCCDELYTLHKGGVAGPGLIGWLTRGRELKQSFLGLTQRPAWLSQFLFSESDFIGSMSLSLPKDRKRMEEMTGRVEFMRTLPPHHWLWYEVAAENLRYFGPVPA